MDPTPPDWLQEFANLVSRHFIPTEVMPPVGCHYANVDGQWEVTLFAAATEVVGGRRDGAVRDACFSVNVLPITELFDHVHLVQWQAHPVLPDDELGAHVSIEGHYSGLPVWLRLLARAPDRFTAGRYARVNDKLWEEAW